MKIKYRITIIFTLIVSSILFLLCFSVYYFFDLKRESEFKKRLKNRTRFTINLLKKVEGINKDLLGKIDASTYTLESKSIIVYDQNDKEEYSYTEEGAMRIEANKTILEKAKKNGDYYFIKDDHEAVAVAYTDNQNTFVVVTAAYDKDGFQKLSMLALILSLSWVTGVLITFLSGLLFSMRLVLPIRNIINEVKKISSQNLSRRIDTYKSKDELGELASTFNELLTRLQESFDIQGRFIANASHELSTPLASISSQLEIALQNERSTDEYKTLIYSVYEDVRTLTQLTRSLLEIAKASGTTDGIELSLVRVDELLMKIPAELKKSDARYNAELHFDSFPDDEDRLLVFGNADLLYSAIKNIVINACKYSEDHQANVSLHFLEASVQIRVADNGPGIKKEELELVFQPFYRSKDNITTQGFGLGLSLASTIIKLHKGTIKPVAGKGTVFVIEFPIARFFHVL